MIQVYQRGETVGIWCYVKDWEGNYTNPDNGVKVTLIDPKSIVKVNALNMTPIDEGKYVYYYTSQITDTTGWWRYQCKSQDGVGDDAKYVISEGSFELK